jgi:hypothetical protein
MAQLIPVEAQSRLYDHFRSSGGELAVRLRDKEVETGRHSQPGDRASGDRQQRTGEPGAVSRDIAFALALSDQTLVDVAPSPPRRRLQAGGQRVVGLLVVRPGMAAR